MQLQFHSFIQRKKLLIVGYNPSTLGAVVDLFRQINMFLIGKFELSNSYYGRRKSRIGSRVGVEIR